MSMSDMIYSFILKFNVKKIPCKLLKSISSIFAELGVFVWHIFTMISPNNIHKTIHKWYMNQMMQLQTQIIPFHKV
jgi:hypothetical protein